MNSSHFNCSFLLLNYTVWWMGWKSKLLIWHFPFHILVLSILKGRGVIHRLFSEGKVRMEFMVQNTQVPSTQHMFYRAGLYSSPWVDRHSNHQSLIFVTDSMRTLKTKPRSCMMAVRPRLTRAPSRMKGEKILRNAGS